MTCRILTQGKIRVINTDLRWPKLFFMVFVLVALPLAGQAADFQSCNKCHAAYLSQAQSRPNQHVPFQQQKCAVCHALKEPDLPVKKALVKADAAAAIKRQKIAWLGESAVEDLDHGFVLPGDKLGETLVVEVQGASGKLPRQEIVVPLLAELAEVQDSGKEPEISAVKVLNVKRGVFLSVTIAWQSDSLTYAQVRYGEKELSQTSDPGKRLGRKHQVVLYNLVPNQTYSYRVVSTDLFGRSQLSEPLTFSTAKPLAAATENQDAAGKKTVVDMTSHFQRFGDDYLLELQLLNPATVFIGSKGAVRKQQQPVQQTKQLAGAELSHEGLSSANVLSIVACLNCHKNQDTATHPVNVLPKPGMVIPAEYPTLPDGRISCASCHSTHSSDYEYLSIKHGKRELCVGCHKDML